MLNVTIFLSVTIFCVFLPVKQPWACFFWCLVHYLNSSQVWIIAFERVEIQRFYMNIMAVFVD